MKTWHETSFLWVFCSAATAEYRLLAIRTTPTLTSRFSATRSRENENLVRNVELRLGHRGSVGHVPRRLSTSRLKVCVKRNWFRAERRHCNIYLCYFVFGNISFVVWFVNLFSISLLTIENFFKSASLCLHEIRQQAEIISGSLPCF